ncbi:MAG: GAF domain-containing protein, partial [Candidatus Eremiobacteraeota bacterium]|nr:GAF domain-containing protein [Candidatus Eremiobacteraeota bacterium]
MLAARWLIYLGGGVIALLYSYFSGGSVITTSIYRLLFVLVSTLAYLAYLSYFGHGRLPLPMRLGLIFCEVSLVSLVVALTGGLASPFVSMLWLLVILNSVDHGEQLGVAAALLGCLGLGAMARGMGAYSPSQLGGFWLGLVAMGALGFVLGGRQSSEVSYGGDAGREIDRAHRIARQQSRERKVREEQLYYERRRFEGLVEVANSLASLRSRDELLNQIVDRALEQMEVEAAAVMLLDEENNLMVSEARGVSIPTRQRLEGPVAECFLGRVLQTGDILTFDESQTHDVLHHYGELGAFSEVVRGSHQALNQGFTNRGETFRNFIVVPLFTSQDRFSFGLLFVANLRSRDCYSSNDVGYLRILATNAAIALRNLEAKARIEQTHFEMIQALAQAIEAKDLYTSNHVGRVRDL